MLASQEERIKEVGETYGRSRGGEEDEAAQVRGALVGQGTGSVDQSADGV